MQNIKGSACYIRSSGPGATTRSGEVSGTSVTVLGRWKRYFGKGEHFGIPEIVPCQWLLIFYSAIKQARRMSSSLASQWGFWSLLPWGTQWPNVPQGDDAPADECTDVSEKVAPTFHISHSLCFGLIPFHLISPFLLFEGNHRVSPSFALLRREYEFSWGLYYTLKI